MSLKLTPGEQVVFEGHPSWRAILAFYLKGVLITAAIVVALALADKLVDFIGTGALIIILIAGAAITVLAGFIKRVSTQYTITNRRLHIKRGILSRDVQQTRLERVQDVNYTQTVLERLLQVGDIDFDTATTDATTFVFAGVDDPEEVVEAVDHANRIRGGSGLGDDEAEIPG
jgi:uncharacterized membrane protein YdbT with pleckstrin-like domain